MRYLYNNISELSRRKMLFITGPRQVGKTKLLKAWISEHSGSYFSYDIPADRAVILGTQAWKDILLEHTSNSIIGIDELHKYARWKNLLKGIYDKYKEDLRILVTGSARLDYFRRGGDSLFGRYEHLRLHPFSLGEVLRAQVIKDAEKAAPPLPPDDWLSLESLQPETGTLDQYFERLYTFTGFPEPYTERDPLLLNRWSRQRLDLLVKEDLRDLSQIQEISLVDHLARLLPERVASPLSHQALAGILQVSHGSIVKWVKWLHALYYVFSLPVYSKHISKSLLKARKLYLWDYSPLKEEGQRFENLVALHLLKSVQFWTDLGYGDYELWYVRNREGKEVDFLITKDDAPLVTIEAKVSAEWPSSLKQHSEALGVKQALILVREHGIDIRKPNVRMVSASKYLGALV